MTATTHDAGVGTRFSDHIRLASRDAHRRAEQSPFVSDLLTGTVDRSRYARYLAQLHAVYDALEQAAEVMRNNSIAGPFVRDELFRLPRLEADLRFLLGDSWSVQAELRTATRAYRDRLLDVAHNWPGGFVAHHYLRYLGDLSGGQILRRLIDRTYGLHDHAGGSFYVFEHINDPASFKRQYRELLDRAPWDDAEKERIVGEVILGFELNTRMFDAL